MPNVLGDVFVWGNHWGSVNAAVEAARQGYRVYLLSPTEHIGEPCVFGLGATDIGRYGSRNYGQWTNKEFLLWLSAYIGGSSYTMGRTCPSVAEQGFKYLCDRYGVNTIANVVLEAVNTTPVSITTNPIPTAAPAGAFGAMPEAMLRIDSVDFHIFSTAFDANNPTMRADWDATLNYAIANAVTRLGITYVSLTANTNVAPETSPADWQPVVVRDNWTSTANYVLNDFVTHVFPTYRALGASQNKPPTSNPAQWQTVVLRNDWNAARAYAANDGVIFLGVNYIARNANTNVPPNTPDTLDWFSANPPLSRKLTARHYIDPDEQGDLMTLSGAIWKIGREDDAVTHEGIAGFQPADASFRPFDCFVSPGVLLHGFWPWPTVDGTPTGTKLVTGNLDPSTDQIYGFRSPGTGNPPNLRRWPRPVGLTVQTDLVQYPFGYDTSLFDYQIRAAGGGHPFIPGDPTHVPPIPDQPATGMYANEGFKPVTISGRTMQDKTDINNDSGIWQVDYNLKNFATRAGRTARRAIKVAHEVERYGFLYHCYVNGSAGTQAYMASIGMSADEFVVPSASDGGTRGLPFSFYPRGYKRLADARYTMTRMDLQSATIEPVHAPGGNTVKPDGVTCDFYSIDNHVNRRIGSEPDGSPLMRLYPRGDQRIDWNATRNYVANDRVTQLDATYVALTSSLNSRPDISPAQWRLTVQRDDWSYGVSYVANDIATYVNKVYLALNASLNSKPDTSPADWRLTVPRDEWSAAVDYFAGDEVTQAGETYVARFDNVGAPPNTTPGQWTHSTMQAGYIFDGLAVITDTIQRRVTPGYHRSYYSAFPRNISNLAVPNNCGATSVAMSSLRIDYWKANYAGVYGYAAALALRLGIEMFQCDPTTIRTDTEAMGNVITPNVPDFSTPPDPADLEDETLEDTFNDENVLLSHGVTQWIERGA